MFDKEEFTKELARLTDFVLSLIAVVTGVSSQNKQTAVAVRVTTPDTEARSARLPE